MALPAKRAQGENVHTRHIPVAVKAVVYKRDEGYCSFVGSDGRKCGSTWGLEFDHIVPFAKGGASTVDNVRLTCRAHNLFQAERVFGREHVASKIEKFRWRSDAAAAVKLEAGPQSSPCLHSCPCPQ